MMKMLLLEAVCCITATSVLSAPRRAFTIAVAGNPDHSVAAGERVRLVAASHAQTTLNVSVAAASGKIGEAIVVFTSDRLSSWRSRHAVDVTLVADESSSSSSDAPVRLVLSSTLNRWDQIHSVSTILAPRHAAAVLPVSDALAQMQAKLDATEKHAALLASQLSALHTKLSAEENRTAELTRDNAQLIAGAVATDEAFSDCAAARGAVSKVAALKKELAEAQSLAATCASAKSAAETTCESRVAALTLEATQLTATANAAVTEQATLLAAARAEVAVQKRKLDTAQTLAAACSTARGVVEASLKDTRTAHATWESRAAKLTAAAAVTANTVAKQAKLVAAARTKLEQQLAATKKEVAEAKAELTALTTAHGSTLLAAKERKVTAATAADRLAARLAAERAVLEKKLVTVTVKMAKEKKTCVAAGVALEKKLTAATSATAVSKKTCVASMAALEEKSAAALAAAKASVGLCKKELGTCNTAKGVAEESLQENHTAHVTCESRVAALTLEATQLTATANAAVTEQATLLTAAQAEVAAQAQGLTVCNSAKDAAVASKDAAEASLKEERSAHTACDDARAAAAAAAEAEAKAAHSACTASSAPQLPTGGDVGPSAAEVNAAACTAELAAMRATFLDETRTLEHKAGAAEGKLAALELARAEEKAAAATTTSGAADAAAKLAAAEQRSVKATAERDDLASGISDLNALIHARSKEVGECRSSLLAVESTLAAQREATDAEITIVVAEKEAALAKLAAGQERASGN